MNIFLTGATGYLGTHLIPEVLRRGRAIADSVDNPPRGVRILEARSFGSTDDLPLTAAAHQ
jgi:nucleoside-diphosphate-sugar epimerase